MEYGSYKDWLEGSGILEEYPELEDMTPDEQQNFLEGIGLLRAKGGRIGLALGGEPDPYMEDYRDKVIRDPILEPGDEMMPDDEQGIVSMLQDEQDPERKVMLAIQIIQSMGDRGIEIVQSILSPEEIAMAVQVIQQMDTGADQGIDSIQMAAEGGRIGFQDGGLNRLRAEYGFTPLSEDQLSGGWSQQAADLTGLFDRRYGGYSGDLSYAYGRGFDPQATKSALAKKLGTTDIREQGQDMQRYNKALNEIKADQLKNVRDVEESYGLSVSDKERDLIRNALGGQLGMLSNTPVATSSEALHKARFDNYMAMRNLSKYLETSDLGDRFSQALGPEEMIEAAPVSAQAAVTPTVAPSATPTEASPTMTTPAAVTPAALTPAAETAPALQSFNPMTYQTSYTTPTVADPTTNMSQNYSDVLSTPNFDFNSSAFNASPAADTAANVASQYLNPQEAQLYQGAANGGRIGFANGGDEELLDPGVMQTDPDELLNEIETQGGLQTASSMGDVFMQAMEDSSVLELDSWLMKYQPFGLREDDYFNFRTMGPQARGPEATEGLATLRV